MQAKQASLHFHSPQKRQNRCKCRSEPWHDNGQTPKRRMSASFLALQRLGRKTGTSPGEREWPDAGAGQCAPSDTVAAACSPHGVHSRWSIDDLYIKEKGKERMEYNREQRNKRRINNDRE